MDYLTDTLLREDLQRLITEDGAWKAFVEAAELSSEEQAALHDALKEYLTQPPKDENDGAQKELQKKRFLKEFPQLKSKLEEHIKKLRELAAHIDEVHSGCTISNVVADSTSTASGVLGILGLVLAPITGGTSLMLSATSLGLLAGLTSITTTVVEEISRQSDEAEASRLVGASMDTLGEVIKILPKMSVKFVNISVDLISGYKTLKEQVRAIRMARAGKLSVQGSRGVENALGNASSLSITRAARIRGAGFTSIFLGLDVYHLVTDTMHLFDGAKSESAGALRDLAQKLQGKLEEFEHIHSVLKADLPQ
ncbi:apolipoprotein L3-like [Acomys russatus]|uniref:apolipoprotein L3-like n=1 Tax=Acomys russatus TaxID=60746 RepID=UPI0021E3303A|nr:apolipoprotein L3-like [Acomys russatus]